MTAQNMGKKILTEAGFEVIAVSNGAAAVKKIAERRPDLAVLDVYMPGYTGPEVCERVKNAHETNQMPVLLTIGKMEMGSFKMEDASRVKADGVIIKPFEASDLLAAIQKLQEKMSLKATVVATPHGPDELPEYERTVKIAAPVFDEKDESYASWKSGAEEHVDENLPASVPREMQASPAFADELEAVRPVAGTRSTEAIDPPASSTEAPTAELTPAATSDIGFQPSSGPEFEPTSAPQSDSEPEVAPALGFEPTSPQSSEEVEAHAVDPALVTDTSEMASAFPTKFGLENADVVPVGNASDYPGLYDAPAGAAEPIETSAGIESEQYPTAVEAPAPEAGSP